MVKLYESETFELKKSLGELQEGIVSLCAMLNKHGHGEVWFGVDQAGNPVGLDIGEKTPRDVSQAIAEQLEPKVYPCISVENLNGKNCLKIACEGHDAPYYARGRAYIRVADADRKLSPTELENMILFKHHDALRWDKKPSKTTFSELDELKASNFVARAELEWDNLENVLAKLDCLTDGVPVNAALLFFGKRPAAKLRCAVFATTSSSTILDQHDYEGDILHLIEEAQKYILKNIHIGMELDGLYRVDVPEISQAAFREAIINAFCHRDYRDPDEVRVAIYKDRVEIRNPGSLYGGLTMDDLRKGHVSKRRNPLVAQMLGRIHMVEGWGRGMPLILENEPTVEFKEIAEIFITVFRRKSFQETEISNASVETGTTTKTSTKTDIKTSTKTDTINPATLIQRGSKDWEILEEISKNPLASLDDLANCVGLKRGGIRYHIDKLRKMGLLSREGTKGGKWIINFQS